MLFCTGTRRPRVVISRSAVELLDRDELAAALAHELAHLERRDPTLSWALMGARALMWFNPGVQVLVRAIARDAERIADERAGQACGDRLALASGLLKLYRATEGRGRAAGPREPAALGRARRAHRPGPRPRHRAALPRAARPPSGAGAAGADAARRGRGRARSPALLRGMTAATGQGRWEAR